MNNREQIAWAVQFSEYSDREVAEILCEMIDAIGGSTYHYREPLEKWLGLECDKDTNNWGELAEEERLDYFVFDPNDWE